MASISTDFGLQEVPLGHGSGTFSGHVDPSTIDAAAALVNQHSPGLSVALPTLQAGAANNGMAAPPFASIDHHPSDSLLRI